VETTAGCRQKNTAVQHTARTKTPLSACYDAPAVTADCRSLAAAAAAAAVPDWTSEDAADSSSVTADAASPGAHFAVD